MKDCAVSCMCADMRTRKQVILKEATCEFIQSCCTTEVVLILKRTVVRFSPEIFLAFCLVREKIPHVCWSGLIMRTF